MLALEPYNLKQTSFKNRIVMPPMCMYQAIDGFINDFHLVHYTTRALGNVAYIIVEATAVSPEGRITDNDLGLWSDDFIPQMTKLVEMVHHYGAKIGIQLAHAGRKSQSSVVPHFAPSAIGYSADYLTPNELTKDQIKTLVKQFKDAAHRADLAGFDAVEVHGAHGYLVNEFISPLCNHRTDEYGKDRGLFLKEILEAIHQVWPKHKLCQVRVSAYEYHPEGNTAQDVAELLRPLTHLLDMVHVSSGGVVSTRVEFFSMYQVQYAKIIKETLKVPVIAVGLITSIEEVERVLYDENADMIALGRELLRNPYFTNNLYAHIPLIDKLPESYLRAYK
ncbi:MAG: tRNA-dihydrouridine synthase [Erysipelotrichaceae bacterium]